MLSIQNSNNEKTMGKLSGGVGLQAAVCVCVSGGSSSFNKPRRDARF